MTENEMEIEREMLLRRAKKKAEKRSGKDKNGKNRQK